LAITHIKREQDVHAFLQPLAVKALEGLSGIQAFIAKLRIVKKVAIHGVLAVLDQPTIETVLVVFGGENQVAIFIFRRIVFILGIYAVD